MYQEIIKEKKKDLDRAIEHLQSELGKVRAGRANVSLVEDLMVDYYGNKIPLKQIASINVPEPRQITIQPWDKGAMVYIESAICESDLGINPANDGNIIRLNIPSLTEERRKELVKILNSKSEEGRIALRNIREEILKKVTKMEKDAEISEDDLFRAKDQIQEIISEYNKKVEEIREKKEKDIMTV